MTDITLHYLTWLERDIGRGSETVVLPEGTDTVDAVLDYLAAKGGRYEVFAKKHIIFANIDGQVVPHNQHLVDVEKIYFFSPVVGG